MNDVAYFRMYGGVKRIPFGERYQENGEVAYDTDGGFVIEVNKAFLE